MKAKAPYLPVQIYNNYSKNQFRYHHVLSAAAWQRTVCQLVHRRSEAAVPFGGLKEAKLQPSALAIYVVVHHPVMRKPTA